VGEGESITITITITITRKQGEGGEWVFGLFVGVVWLSVGLVVIALLFLWWRARPNTPDGASSGDEAEPEPVDLPDSDGWTSLMRAAQGGHAESVSRLLSWGADVNARNPQGRTALSLAEERGHTYVVELLKQAGAKY
jgi:ankyrin repeat protein